MTVKNKTNLFYLFLTAAALLLGLAIQLLLTDIRFRESSMQAENAFMSFSAAVAEKLAEKDEQGDTAYIALELNSEAKAERVEELKDLSLLMLVNPWNPIPEGYTQELTYLNDVAPELYDSNAQELVDSRCAEALAQMMLDCRSEGMGLYLCSAYRPHEKQIMLYENKVERVMAEGYSIEEAPEIAAQTVAFPGTSEHELGLAVDILDVNYPYLNEHQEETAGQQWLIEHCWDYGFILRYPNGSSDTTGIIYEPWHYRYVGKEYAGEIRDLGVTLEEYVAMRRGR